MISKRERRSDSLRKELAQLRELALSELERRGYNVRGKTSLRSERRSKSAEQSRGNECANTFQNLKKICLTL